MLNSPLIRRAIALLALIFMIGADVAARAEKPFMYYPAYGSSRGHIRYVDGLLRNKQKIHWGNGVTDNGVLVMRDLAAAAQVIVPKVVHGAEAPAEDAAKAHAANIADAANDLDLQNKANALLSRNELLLARVNKLPGKTPAVVTPETPTTTPTSVGLEVVFLYESEKLVNYSAEVAGVFVSAPIKRYLRSHCRKINENVAGFFYDNDVTPERVLADTDEAFLKIVEEARLKSAPEEKAWMVVYKDGKKVVDEEVTKGAAEVLKQLTDIGG